MEKRKRKIKITENGPYLVSGGLPLAKENIVVDANGDSKSYKKGESYNCGDSYLLCRCGGSHNKPFCDSSHKQIGFIGKETASRQDFSKECNIVSGPAINLYDSIKLCARARFCHDRKSDIWKDTKKSDKQGSKQEAVRRAKLCPAGRLVVEDKTTGKIIEPIFTQEIGLIEDPRMKTSGPIWVKGGVEIESADGYKYEIRNRVTLCRCGKSRNKPFCDGCHIDTKFNDGDGTLN